MAVDINSITPLVLDSELVRTLFRVNQTADPPLSDVADASARWNFQTDAGTGVALTYAFSATAPGYDPGDVDPSTYAALNAAEQANCEASMAIWAECVDVTFTKVANAANADIVFRKVDLTLPPSTKGFAFFPPLGGESAQNGDVFLDLTGAGIRPVVVHELGHVLGLGHPFENGTRPTPGDLGFDDNQLLSIMSYSTPPRDLLFTLTQSGAGYASLDEPQVPMPVDILAAQLLYGANMSTRTGNDVYSFDVDPVFYSTIWDAGGIDTIDCSNQANPSLISLVAGSFSTIALRDPMEGASQQIRDAFESAADRFFDGSNALAIAFDCVIEHAKGGSAGDRLIGNTAKNKLTGNGGNDTMTGSGGNDTLLGGTGNDSLDGGTGNDSVDGGAGTDTLVGGGGNDTFVVSAGDVVTEKGGGGTDTVKTALNYTLGANVENLLLTGAGNVRGNGNGLGNTLTGNTHDNTLLGAGGGDKLLGGAGNDLLRGGLGNDTLTGGAGSDVFQFDTALGAANIDRLADFLAVDDTIQLDQTVFGALGLGTLAPAQFRAGAGVSTAGDGNDRILYNTTTGALFYDADGNAAGSAALQFALLTGAPGLAAADFAIIA